MKLRLPRVQFTSTNIRLIVLILLVSGGLYSLGRIAAFPTEIMIVTVDDITLKLAPFGLLILLALDYFGKDKSLRSKEDFLQIGFMLLTYLPLVDLSIYLYFWNRFPEVNTFEARFTLSTVIFASLLYIGNKLGIKNFDIREVFFLKRDRSHSGEEDKTS